MMPSEFHTRRLTIRRPLHDDVDAIFKFSSNSDVTKWLDWPTSSNIDSVVANLAHWTTRWERGDEYFWVITTSDTCVVVGSMASRIHGDTADVGFLLDTDQWNRGIATEAAIGLREQLEKMAGIVRIVAICDKDNAASARVLQKAGLSCKGIAEKFITCPNISTTPRDALIYSCNC